MKFFGEFVCRKIDEKYAVIPVNCKEPFSGVLWVNEEGKAIMELLKQEITRQELIDKLSEQFDAPKDEVAASADAFITQLKENGMLV